MPAKTYAWVYTDDLGHEYSIKVKKATADQTTGGALDGPKIGGRAEVAADGLLSIPNGLRPRTASVSNAAGVSRTVICMEPLAPLYTGVPKTGDTGGNATQITLRDTLGATSTYFRQGSTAERRERRGAKTVA